MAYPPPMTLITGLDHVQVEAPAGCEAQARAFFGSFLSLPELVKPEVLRRNGGVWFGLPDGWQQPVGVTPEVVPRGHPGVRRAAGGSRNREFTRLTGPSGRMVR